MKVVCKVVEYCLSIIQMFAGTLAIAFLVLPRLGGLIESFPHFDAPMTIYGWNWWELGLLAVGCSAAKAILEYLPELISGKGAAHE